MMRSAVMLTQKQLKYIKLKINKGFYLFSFSFKRFSFFINMSIKRKMISYCILTLHCLEFKLFKYVLLRAKYFPNILAGKMKVF